MDFRTLRYVLAIADYQNITKAAEALFVGQPTLSKFMISIENELGLKLFRRMGHRYLLTYAGERYVEHARQILRMKEELDAEMADILKRDVGVLRVAFPLMRGSYLLPRVLPAFQARYPNVKVVLLEGSSSENDRRLLDGRVDLAFYSKPEQTNVLIEYQTLAQEELLLCAQKGHPLEKLAKAEPGSAYPYIELSLIQDERLLLLQPGQRTRQIVDALFSEHHIQPTNTLCTSNIRVIVGLVSEGYGLSFLFDSHLRSQEDQRSIRCFRFGSTPIRRDFVAACRAGSYLPHYAYDFIEIAKEAVSTEPAEASG
jgi:DNA-binding transcriptional LysR family regulator